MRACEGRLTRRRSWQQSARKDRPAGVAVVAPVGLAAAPAVHRGAVDLATIRVLASGRLIQADVALQALAATIADQALSQ